MFLLIDDIFDEGITLKAIVEELGKEKPLTIESCVLLNKEHDRKVADFDVDFVPGNLQLAIFKLQFAYWRLQLADCALCS